MEVFGFAIDSLADEELEIEPEVPFTEILNEENNYIVLKFDNKIDWINALGVLGIEKVKAFPTKKSGNKKTFGERMKYKDKEIVIACPSYKRPVVETLQYIPFCKVYVSPEEYKTYLEFNPKHKVH